MSQCLSVLLCVCVPFLFRASSWGVFYPRAIFISIITLIAYLVQRFWTLEQKQALSLESLYSGGEPALYCSSRVKLSAFEILSQAWDTSAIPFPPSCMCTCKHMSTCTHIHEHLVYISESVDKHILLQSLEIRTEGKVNLSPILSLLIPSHTTLGKILNRLKL